MLEKMKTKKHRMHTIQLVNNENNTNINNNNNNCLKSNIQCIEIRVQWTVGGAYIKISAQVTTGFGIHDVYIVLTH